MIAAFLLKPINKNVMKNKKKSPEANLENRRLGHTCIGLIIAGSISLAALEWTSVEATPLYTTLEEDLADDEIDIMIDFEIPEPEEETPVEQKKPKVEKFFPEPEPTPEPDPSIDPSNISETQDPAEQSESGEVGYPTGPVYVPPAKVEMVHEIYNVTKKPEFPGGESAMYKWLGNHIKYPRQAREIGHTGKVTVAFTVWKDGSIKDVEIVKGIGIGCDVEVQRVIELMPTWSPGEMNGAKVAVRYVMPVWFRLK